MNKEYEIAYFRTNIIKKYVTEVMDRINREESLPKRLCICCKCYKPLEQFYQYKQDKHIVYSRFCKQCLHKTSKKTKK